MDCEYCGKGVIIKLSVIDHESLHLLMFHFVKCSWYCEFQLLYCHSAKPAWRATPFFSSNQEVPDMYYKSIIFQFSWRGKLKSIIYCCNCQKQCILVIKVTKNLERALPPPLLDKIQNNSRFFSGNGPSQKSIYQFW